MPDNLTTHSTITFADMDRDLRLIAQMPDYIQNWVLFEAPVSLDVADILQEYDHRMQGTDVFFGHTSESQVWAGVFADMKQIYRAEALEFYGRDYPSCRSKSWVRRPLDARPRRVLW